MQRARVLCTPEGDVARVLVAGEEVQFDKEVLTQHAVPAKVMCRLSTPDTRPSPPIAAALEPYYPNCLAIVILPNARLDAGCALPTGVAYVLPSAEKPVPRDFFPFPTEYATGLSMVEIEPRLTADGMQLSMDFLNTPQFLEKLQSLRERLRRPARVELQPGVVQADALRDLSRFATPAFAADALMHPYRPDWQNIWEPNLGPKDYVALAVSDWTKVSEQTKAAEGHVSGQLHFYVIVKFSLQPEVVDQVVMTRFENPGERTLGELAAHPLFKRALDVSEGSRELLAKASLAHLGLAPKQFGPQHAPHFTHTTWNVLDSLRVVVGSSKGKKEEGVMFYAGCAPSHRAERGALVERGQEREDDVLWLHGPFKAGVTGGTGWKMPPTCNAIPSDGVKWTKSLFEGLETSGWARESGYARLQHVHII